MHTYFVYTKMQDFFVLYDTAELVWGKTGNVRVTWLCVTLGNRAILFEQVCSDTRDKNYWFAMVEKQWFRFCGVFELHISISHIKRTDVII